MSDTKKDDSGNQKKLDLLKKLAALRLEEKVEKGFQTKLEFLNWGARVEPLLSFNPAYEEEFSQALHVLHARLSSITAVPLADTMRTVLTKAIEKLKYETDLTEDNREPDLKQGETNMIDSKTVFVVHGRDEKLRSDFFDFLRTLDLRPIEWSQAVKLTGKASPYIGEILDSAFDHAQAVIVLLSPDDEVRLSPDLCKDDEEIQEIEFRLQARPNVLFEAGMAMGRDPKRTLLIEVGGVKKFSDVGGRHVVRLKDTPESRKDIADRLETAGCDVSTDGKDWFRKGKFNVRRKIVKEAGQEDLSPVHENLIGEDIITLLTEWWPKDIKSARDGIIVNFAEVDQILRLPSGSAKKHIRQVAASMEFKERSFGNVFASFEYDEGSPIGGLL